MTRSDLGFRRWAAALLDQQLWCLGRDVARPAGNLLLDLGMCRYRDPAGAGGTLYTAAVPPGGSLFLWGFGAMYAEPGAGGLFVRRYSFAPRLTARETAVGVHDPTQLGRLTAPAGGRETAVVRRLLPRLAGWFARYEHWVAEALGPDYRAGCLTARGKPAVVPAAGMAAAWERAARRCARHHGGPAVVTGPWAGLFRRLAAPPRPPAATRPPFRVRK